MAVPTQINVGDNAPANASSVPAGGEAIGAGACVRWGYSVDMSIDHLNALYPSHADYVAKVKNAAMAAEKAGFLLPQEAEEEIQKAETASIP